MKLMGKTSIVRIAVLLLFVVGISMLHYLTPLHGTTVIVRLPIIAGENI